MPDGALSEALLEQSPACFWLVNAKGRFERAYGNTTAVFGKPAAQLEGRPVLEVLSAEDAGLWMDRLARALSGETLRLHERFGGALWYVSVFPVSIGGGPRYAGGMGSENTPWNKAEEELRHTVLGALKAQEFERGAMSRFLHDKVGQNMTALGLQLDLVRMDLEATLPGTSERINEIQRVLEAMMEEVRGYSYALHPNLVERAGLRAALDRMVEQFRGRFTGSVRLNADPSLRLDLKVSSAFYHIAQEALENAVQHSGCSFVEIAVKSPRSGPVLEVRDNGRGFDPADLLAGRRGLGLLSMEHYAAQAGLDLSITSHREGGTMIRASITGAD